ncbi:MAG: pseudouridine synthase [Bacteroidales bacterium]|nr:pseudouridine synthase [Bacteroidales bacterium]
MTSLPEMAARENVFHRVATWHIEGGHRPFTYPFAYTPDDKCREAAEMVKEEMTRRSELSADIASGKMFGVLVCMNENGEMGFIASFSGTLGGRSHQKWFAPPLLDYEQEGGIFKTEEIAISTINERICAMETNAEYASKRENLIKREAENALTIETLKKRYAENREARKIMRAEKPEMKEELDKQSQFEKAEIKRTAARLGAETEKMRDELAAWKEEIEHLKTERKRRSNILQRWLFSRMKARCADGRSVSVWDIFQEAGRGVPPSGTGECAAPKLLNYAFSHGLRPICMAEFWMGTSPKGEIRDEGHFYPACNTKCGPLLARMMRGMDVEANPLEAPKAGGELKIVFEDEWLVVVDKPCGLMTVDESGGHDSLMGRIRTIRTITGPGYVHRLDMATSGIVVIAKDKETHAAMQRLFETRQIKKRYVAIVDGTPSQKSGVISLPLIPNIEDRPRQMVDFIRGKEAVTEYEVCGSEGGRTRINLYPLTGRTHQLRVHLANPMGLGCPIVGDNLYGRLGERLLLHSDAIWFTHPHTGEAIHIESPAEF